MISEGQGGAHRSRPDQPPQAASAEVFSCPQARGVTPAALATPGAFLHQAHEDAAGGTHSPPRKRVLVVDDNVGSAESLALILSLWGHESQVAFNGIDAIESAHSYLPHVILLDLCLPGMDGFAVARVLREDPRFERTPLLAMTGYHDDGDRQLARELGFDRIFLKPLNLPELEANLARLSQPADLDR